MGDVLYLGVEGRKRHGVIVYRTESNDSVVIDSSMREVRILTRGTISETSHPNVNEARWRWSMNDELSFRKVRAVRICSIAEKSLFIRANKSSEHVPLDKGGAYVKRGFSLIFLPAVVG